MKRNSGRLVFRLFGMAAVLFVTSLLHRSYADGTSNGTLAQEKKEIEARNAAIKIGKSMDEAERYLEEYGSISISVPLVAKLGEDFKFDLNRGASNYFNDAKTQIQGAAASFNQVVQSFSFGAQAQMDPTVAAAYAAQLQNYFGSLQRYQTHQNLLDQAAQQQLQADLAAANTNTNAAARSAAIAQALQSYAQNYSAPSNAPSYPTADQANTNLPSLPNGLAKRPSVTNVLSGSQFLPFQSLLNGLNLKPSISDRSALITSAGDVATESIFRHFIGNTNLVTQDAEDNIYFGFSTVSVNPGWRTSKGWAAEAIMTAEIYYTNARQAVIQKEFEKIAADNIATAAEFYIEYGDEDLPKNDKALNLSRAYIVSTRHLLVQGDILDVPSFIRDLEDTNHALSQYLLTHVSSDLRRRMAVYEATNSEDFVMQSNLVDQINRIISIRPIHPSSYVGLPLEANIELTHLYMAYTNTTAHSWTNLTAYNRKVLDLTFPDSIRSSFTGTTHDSFVKFLATYLVPTVNLVTNTNFIPVTKTVYYPTPVYSTNVSTRLETNYETNFVFFFSTNQVVKQITFPLLTNIAVVTNIKYESILTFVVSNTQGQSLASETITNALLINSNALALTGASNTQEAVHREHSESVSISTTNIPSLLSDAVIVWNSTSESQTNALINMPIASSPYFENLLMCADFARKHHLATDAIGFTNLFVRRSNFFSVN